jgi:hypothetical protein
MTMSEYLEWEEYLGTTPDIQEVQLANIAYMIASQYGSKNISQDMFMITKQQSSVGEVSDITQMTKEQINELLGA